MNGTIQDMALRQCRKCLVAYIEDDRMYLDVDRCPNCGAYASAWGCFGGGASRPIPDPSAPEEVFDDGGGLVFDDAGGLIFGE
jgi:hypothetical protein